MCKTREAIDLGRVGGRRSHSLCAAGAITVRWDLHRCLYVCVNDGGLRGERDALLAARSGVNVVVGYKCFADGLRA